MSLKHAMLSRKLPRSKNLCLIIGLILILWICVKLPSRKPFRDDQMGIGSRQKTNINHGYSLLALCCYTSEFDASDQSQGSNIIRSSGSNMKTISIKLDAEYERVVGLLKPRRKSGELNGTTGSIIRLLVNASVAETSSYPINISAPLASKADNSNESLSKMASRDSNNQVESLINSRLSELQFSKKEYKVLHIFGQPNGDLQLGHAPFKKCKHSKCLLSNSPDIVGMKHVNSDAVLFDITNLHYATQLSKPSNQVWVLSLMESPLNTPNISSINGLINWTTTYRLDSTIHTPYNEYIEKKSKSKYTQEDEKKLFRSKTKLVAWFVTNCGSKNGRLKYVQELQKHIPVDIYGLCGPLSCDRESDYDCLTMLRKKYKFYLSFENSNCKDYISEKFWKALSFDTVPVVMGATRQQYENVGPPNSFIHVQDFTSPKALAAYLKNVAANESKYLEYFEWKQKGQITSTSLWCKLCAKLHTQISPSWFENLDRWWSPKGICEKPDYGDFELDVVLNNLLKKKKKIREITFGL